MADEQIPLMAQKATHKDQFFLLDDVTLYQLIRQYLVSRTKKSVLGDYELSYLVRQLPVKSRKVSVLCSQGQLNRI